jgi:hypothetical protein
MLHANQYNARRSLLCRCLPPIFHLLYVLPYSCSTSRNDGVRLWVSLIDVSTGGQAGGGKIVRFEVGRAEGAAVWLYKDVSWLSSSRGAGGGAIQV